MITNPIIRGFNPDPSICRVGEDYYVATSTFQFYPGIQIHHSRDLKNWRLLTHALTEKKHFNLEKLECSNGIWAPQITHDGESFYLLFACVTSTGGAITDSPTFLVTSKDIMGPWSDAVFLRGGGFDPSIFHDDDGKKYWVNMQMGEPGVCRFNGIFLQEYDAKEQKLVGKMSKIFNGTALGITEGPHIYKRNGYYYLLTAEGGTSINHVVTICRSRDIWGPYEVCENNPILTTKFTREDFPFRSAGHGDLVETQDGEFYMVHLLQRKVLDKKIPSLEVSPLGRETAIQKIIWTHDGWPCLANGTNLPDVELVESDLKECKWELPKSCFDFTKGDKLDIHYSFLREKLSDNILAYTSDGLRLTGQESLNSRNKVSFIGHRLQNFDAEFGCTMEFYPESYRQTAGIVAYYDRLNYLYLHVLGVGEDNKRKVKLTFCHNRDLKVVDLLLLDDEQKDIELRIFINNYKYHFECNKQVFDINYPITALGDGASDYSGFTGTFLGIATEDHTMRGNSSMLIKKLFYKEL